MQVRLQLPEAWGRCMIKHWRVMESLHVVVLDAHLSAFDMDNAPQTLQVGDATYELITVTRTLKPKFIYLGTVSR